MQLEFWFEPASTYAYLSAMRIERLAEEAGVAIVWRPFLLGPIFGAQGWDTSPFNVYPAKGRYMVRDITRIAEARGLKFVLPDPFPAHTVLAARVALVGADKAWGPAFVKAMYLAEFAERRNIADPAVITNVLAGINVEDPDTVLSAATAQENKDALRAETERAQSIGIFGAPSFVTPDGELFWGDDRLEMALAWVNRKNVER